MKRLIWKLRYTYCMYRKVKGSVKWLEISWQCAEAALVDSEYELTDSPKMAVDEELSYWSE